MSAKTKSVDLPFLLQSIVTSAEDAIVAKDMDGTILFWNQGAQKLYGWKPEEVVGKSITVIIPSIKHSEFLDIMDSLPLGKKLEHHETIRMAKDGKLVQVSVTISPIYDNSGTIIGASSIARDITKQKAIQNERAMLASIVDSSEDGIYSMTLSGIIISWNRGAEKIFGYRSQEILGRSVSLLAPREHQDEMSSLLEKIRDGEHIDHYETIRIRKDESVLDVSLTISPIRGAHGTVVGASTIARDITERKKKDDLIRSQLSEKEVLLQEIHHRVKNNLQVISSLLELHSRYARKNEHKDAAFRESIERIRAISLVHEKLYRTENLATIDLRSYISSLSEDLLNSYRVSNSAINISIVGDTYSVPLNTAVPLGLVLNELITNSIKYAFVGKAGGEITVSIRCEEKLQIALSDNGCGLPQDLDFLSSNTFGFKIVKLLMDQMQGTIELSRTPPGTMFRLAVPLGSG